MLGLRWFFDGFSYEFPIFPWGFLMTIPWPPGVASPPARGGDGAPTTPRGRDGCGGDLGDAASSGGGHL